MWVPNLLFVSNAHSSGSTAMTLALGNLRFIALAVPINVPPVPMPATMASIFIPFVCLRISVPRSFSFSSTFHSFSNCCGA